MTSTPSKAAPSRAPKTPLTPEQALAALFGPKLRNLTKKKLLEYAAAHQLEITERTLSQARWTDPEGREWDLRSRLLYWLIERGSTLPVSAGSKAILKATMETPPPASGATAQSGWLWTLIGQVLTPTGLFTAPARPRAAWGTWASDWAERSNPPPTLLQSRQFTPGRQQEIADRWQAWVAHLGQPLPFAPLDLVLCGFQRLQHSCDAGRVWEMNSAFTDWAWGAASLVSLGLPKTAEATQALLEPGSLPFARSEGSFRDGLGLDVLTCLQATASRADRTSWQPFLDRVLGDPLAPWPAPVLTFAVQLGLADAFASEASERPAKLARLMAAQTAPRAWLDALLNQDAYPLSPALCAQISSRDVPAALVALAAHFKGVSWYGAPTDPDLERRNKAGAALERQLRTWQDQQALWEQPFWREVQLEAALPVPPPRPRTRL